MPFVQVGDLRTHYEISGKGAPLTLIMGLAGDLSWWERLLPELQSDFRVLTFDNRGAGRTDKPNSNYTIAAMAADTEGLLEALDIPQSHVFGISMGGMIAQEFALLFPQRLNRLALGCTHPGGRGMRAPLPEAVQKLTETTGKSVREIAENVMTVLFSASFRRRDPVCIQRLIELYVANPPSGKGFTRQFWATLAHNAIDRLPTLTQPTLIITGDADELIPSVNAQLLQSLIPLSKLVLMPGAGHLFFIEEPVETARLLKEHFLGA